MDKKVVRRNYSQGNKCACGASITNTAQKCKSCAAKNRHLKSKDHKPIHDYSAGNKCPDCGKAITNRAKTCRVCSRKQRKQKVVKGWQERLLGNTQFPTSEDPIGLCEICGENERTPDTWWCGPCQEVIDSGYEEKSLIAKLQREEKKELVITI